MSCPEIRKKGETLWLNLSYQFQLPKLEVKGFTLSPDSEPTCILSQFLKPKICAKMNFGFDQIPGWHAAHLPGANNIGPRWGHCA